MRAMTWLVGLGLSSLFSFSLHAQNTLTTAEQKAGWELLFNGKDLSGWKQLNGQAKYRVEKGEIVGTTVANTPNSFLATEKSYGDFVLELELKVDPSMNSGIQFRSLSKPDYQNGRVHGYQMEIDPSDRAWSGGIYDEGRRDWLYIPNLNPLAKTAFNKNGWNTYRIEAIGSTLRTWVNGQPIAYLVDDLTPAGFIALQVHSIGANQQPGTEIRWRNIKINTKQVKPSPLDQTPVINLLTNQLSDQEKHQGFELLFDGQSLNQWRSVHSQAAPNARWQVKEGTIQIAGTDGSETGNDIVSKKAYGTFEMVFDFKLTPGANSGVKYFVNEAFDSGGKSGIGLEYQILDDERHPDAKMGVVGNRTLASLYDLIPSKKVEKRFQRPIGEWNQGRIRVYPDQTVEHWLNGFLVVRYERNSAIYHALVARSKYQKYDGFGGAAEGLLLLQDHGDVVQYKNIKIRPL